MPHNDILLKRVQLLGSCFLLVLGCLSVWLYMERGTFMDVAFQTFEMVRTRTLAPQVYRFGSAFTQIFPLLSIWLNAPLWTVALMYSVGVIVYQSILFYYIAFVQRHLIFSIAFLISLTLITTHTFFWIQSEYTQSIPFGLALLTNIDSLKNKPLKTIHLLVLIPGIITAVFFHPLQTPLLIVLGGILIWQNGFSKVNLISLLLVPGTWAIKHQFFANWYDNMAGERVAELHKISLKNWLTPGMKVFFNTSYYYPSIFFILVFVYFAFKVKQTLFGISVALVCVVYFLFIHFTHPHAELFYVENLLLGIPAIIGLSFALLVKRDSEVLNQLTISGILIACFSFFFIRIFIVAPYYRERIQLYENLIVKHKHEKIMLPATALPRPHILFAWPSAYEVWILSTIKHQQTASVYFLEDSSKYRIDIPANKQFRGLRNYPYDSLPAPYFIWKDTFNAYRIP